VAIKDETEVGFVGAVLKMHGGSVVLTVRVQRRLRVEYCGPESEWFYKKGEQLCRW
jgi:hypothetical protein